MKFKTLLFILIFIPTALSAEEKALGYIQLPLADKYNVTRVGTPKPVVIGGRQGEIWYDEQSSASRPKKFDVFTSPSPKSEKLVAIDASGAMMQILAETTPGKHSSSSLEDQRKYEQGTSKLVVFEKKDHWVKIKFLDQPPWHGRYGWVELSNNSGGFVSY